MENDILSGWKEIAAHLGKSVRTAQRWEETLALPVHRITGPGGDVVFARASEVDAWRTQASRTRAGRRALERAEEYDAHGTEAPSPRFIEDSPATPNAPAATTPPSSRARSRPRLIVAIGLTCFCAALAVLAVGWWTWRGQPGSVAVSEADAPSGGPAARYTGREGLDSGPWPIPGHDMHRTNQGHLRGPAAATDLRLIYQSKERLTFEPDYPDSNGVFPVATSTGELLFGACTPVLSVDLAGRARTVRSLATRPFREGVSGIAAGSRGRLIVTTRECPPSNGALVNVYALSNWGTGATLVSWPQENTMCGPGVGPDETVYAVSETNMVRAYGGVITERRWATDLPGYSRGMITLDAAGNLYIGTGASSYGQASLWSLTPDGQVRWKVGNDRLSTPVASADGSIVVAGQEQLYSYDTAGRLRWSTRIGKTYDSVIPLAVGRSGTIYARTLSGLVAIDANGRVKWSRPAEEGPVIQNGPILDKDENVYVALGNRVCSLTAGNVQRWCIPLDDPGALLIAADGVLCVVGQHGNIYAIGSPSATSVSAASPRP